MQRQKQTPLNEGNTWWLHDLMVKSRIAVRKAHRLQPPEGPFPYRIGYPKKWVHGIDPTRCFDSRTSQAISMLESS